MAAAKPNSLPTLQEELNEKVFDTLGWLSYGYDQGKMTEEQFSTGVDVLFMAVSGLVPNNFINLVTEAGRLCKDTKPTVRHIFFREEDEQFKHLRLSWMPGEDKIVLTRLVGGQAYKGTVFNFDTPKLARDRLLRLCVDLERKGWVEL